MPSDVILAIDQGTTNTKALLVDRTGRPVFRTSIALTLLHPRPGFVEQDPLHLWQSVLQAIDACVLHARATGLRIEGISISNQRETALAWRPGPQPLAVDNAMSWQCRRSTEICARLRDSHTLMRGITGLPVDPLASAGKWAWLLEHSPSLLTEAERGDVLLGTVDSWLLSILTQGEAHRTDHTNASRTGVFSLSELHWSDQLLKIFGLPLQSLPAVQSSASHFGLCTAIPELGGIPIVSMVGDSHAAFVGHGSFVPGSVKATYGTGSSLMMLTNGLVQDSEELARTVAWSDSEGVRFALEGNIAMTGSAVQWVGEFLGLPHPVEDTVALAESVSDAAGLRFVPAMSGLGAPHWDSQARGLIANLGHSHKAAHLARAAVDAIAFQITDVLVSMERASGVRAPILRVDGGATRNATLMHFQADLIDRPVVRSANQELSALGAAWLGGLTLGWWRSANEFEALVDAATTFTPSRSNEYSGELYRSWHAAVARTRLVPQGKA